jgi:hypothetical protein
MSGIKKFDKDAIAYLERERDFNKGVQNLKSAPVEMVDDFQKEVVKDLPANRIDNRQVQKLSSGADFLAKQRILEAEREAKRAALGKVSGDTLDYSTFRKTGKKLAGVVPFLGAGYAALQGDPAMAAEELAQDAMGPAGLAYEAIRPSPVGNIDEEAQMIAERNAQVNYNNSPAHLAKLKALKGVK